MMQRLGMREDVIDYVIEWDNNPPAEAREPNHVFENIVRRKPSTLMDWLDETATLSNPPTLRWMISSSPLLPDEL